MNSVDDRGAFYISYLENPDKTWDIFSGKNSNGAETAIVVQDPSKVYGRAFYILEGDHREALKGLDEKACVNYWLKNKHLKGEYSDEPPQLLN